MINTLLFVVILASSATTVAHARPLLEHSAIDPPFSWATLPVVWHSANSSGVWSDDQVATLAKYSMVTVEKY